MTIDSILKIIETGKPGKESRIIAIDGQGGSGKSRLAQELADRNSSISLIHFDDFYFPNLNKFRPNQNLPEFDCQRLEREVLIPLSQGKNTKHQRYNWVLNKLDDWIEVNAGKIVIMYGPTGKFLGVEGELPW